MPGDLFVGLPCPARPVTETVCLDHCVGSCVIQTACQVTSLLIHLASKTSDSDCVPGDLFVDSPCPARPVIQTVCQVASLLIHLAR